ncbi:MAG: Ig-like domain-containing protein, partial [Gemmatimonadota bacterium]|nr:Ig-like domain-containing protein [Gemmatimonadota bacterium]
MPYLFKLIKRLSLNDFGVGRGIRLPWLSPTPSCTTNGSPGPARTRPTGARRMTVLTGLVLLGMGACVDAEGPSGGAVELRLSPREPEVALGDSVEFVAFGLTAAGDTVALDVTWSSEAGEIKGKGKGKGLYQPRGRGKDKVKASSDSLADSTTVTVTEGPVAAVVLTPAAAVVDVGRTAQLTATLKDAAGNELTDRTVTWSSTDEAVALVDGTGLVTGQGAGSATVTATCEGHSGSSTVSVTATQAPVASVEVAPASGSVSVGGSLQLTATLKDAAGNELTGRAVTWASSNDAVAKVSASGLVTAMAAGSATIIATSEGQSGTAAITVTQVPVASVEVMPSSLSLSVGQVGQLTATLKDAAGNELTGRAVSWTTSQAAVASVNSNGRVSGVAAGSSTITATSEGQRGTSAITVTSSPPPPGQEVAIPVQSEWTDQGVAIAHGGGGDWDLRVSGASSPCVMVKKGNTYFLYYIGADGNRGDGGPAHRKLGVATSNDGINFTKYGGNPILTHQVGVSPLDEAGIFSAGAFVDDDGTIVLYYGGMEEVVAGSVDSDIVLATSSDGLTWSDLGDVWRNTQSTAPGNEIFPIAVLKQDGTYHVWYMGGGTWELYRVNGSAPDALTTDRQVSGGITNIYDASIIRISDTDLIMAMTNRASDQVQMRRIALGNIDSVGAAEETYSWSNYNEATVYLDRDTMTWFMYQVSDALNEIRV